MNKKHDFSHLWIAGGAVLFVSSLLPLCSSIVDLVQSAINAKIGRIQMDLELDQREAQAAAEMIKPSENSNSNCIGFQIPSENEYEEEYE